jgi:hypothetical protein
MTTTRTAPRTITIELPGDLVAILDTLDGIEDRAWKALVSTCCVAAKFPKAERQCC